MPGKGHSFIYFCPLYTAYYDMDRFRRFVFESRFLDIFEIDQDEIEKIKTDDVALMKLGFRYV